MRKQRQVCSFCRKRDGIKASIPEAVCELRDSACLCEVCIQEAEQVLGLLRLPPSKVNPKETQ